MLLLMPACVISATDDDDDAATAGSSSGPTSDSNDPSGASQGDSSDDGSSSGADESSGDSGDPTAGGEGPQDGAWIYADNGASQNDCTFLKATQGVGDFSIENHGDGTFTITPGDDTDPFECMMGNGDAFSCPERYVESIEEAGFNAVLDAFVTVDGTTTSTQMEGEQLGRLECEGEDCGVAETILGTAFPCSFVIPFTAVAG